MSIGLHSWLISQQSLMDELARQAGEARLSVIRHDEGVSSDFIWQREIVVSANQEPCWFARTVAQERCYENCIDFFEQLRTKKLGDLIYNANEVFRETIVHFPISECSAPYQWLPDSIKPVSSQVLWMRASHFVLREQYAFDLFEIYLPALLRYCR